MHANLENYGTRDYICACTYRATNTNGGLCIVVGQVESNLQARIPTANYQNLLTSKGLTILIEARMHEFPFEGIQPFKVRNVAFAVLARCHHKKLGAVNFLHIGLGVLDQHAPLVHLGIVESRLHDTLISGAYAEVGYVGIQVVDKAIPGDVFRGALRVRHVGKLAKLLSQMKLKAVISPFLPKRTAAVFFLEDYVCDFQTVQACRGCHTRRPGSNYEYFYFLHILEGFTSLYLEYMFCVLE